MPTRHVRITPRLLCAWVILLSRLAAQRAPEPSPTNATAADAKSAETVQMSPFEVQTSQDTGYAAQNTISGSRLNTSLADTPAAISVFTAEFIQDIGATDVIDLVQYSVNTDS